MGSVRINELNIPHSELCTGVSVCMAIILLFPKMSVTFRIPAVLIIENSFIIILTLTEAKEEHREGCFLLVQYLYLDYKKQVSNTNKDLVLVYI